MAKKAKGAVSASLKELSKLAQKSKDRFDAALTKAQKGNYKGADLVADMFEQWGDFFEIWTRMSPPAGAQTAFIYLPANGTATNWDSTDLAFDDPMTTAQVGALTISDLLGPVVGGVQKKIPKANVQVVLKPAAGPSTDFFVRINQTPAAGDTGPYRGLILDAQDLVAEVHVYAY